MSLDAKFRFDFSSIVKAYILSIVIIDSLHKVDLVGGGDV